MILFATGHKGLVETVVETYAVGFARPDRWSQGRPAEQDRPWHAVEASRPPIELDGEVEFAVCGAFVQVWGTQRWARMSAGRTACPQCVRITAADASLIPAG